MSEQRLPSAAEWAARVADACDGIAELTGDARFKRASGVLRGKPIGRRRLDDTSALEMAAAFVDAGLAKSTTDALRRAAVLMAPANQVETTVRRLLRKMRDKSYLSRDKPSERK